MTTIKEQLILKERILLGMELTYIRLIEFKKQKNSVLAVIQDNEIKLIKPE